MIRCLQILMHTISSRFSSIIVSFLFRTNKQLKYQKLKQRPKKQATIHNSLIVNKEEEKL